MVEIDSRIGPKVYLTIQMLNSLKSGNWGLNCPYLVQHVKLSVLTLISPLSCRIAVPLDCESEGTESAHKFAHTVVHYNIICVVG